jgi:acetyltransferase-like isoleucine patch superfamily enzyme
MYVNGYTEHYTGLIKMMKYGTNFIGHNAQIFDPVIIGFPSRAKIGKSGFTGIIIGENAILRSGTVIYCDVVIGNDFQTGHNVIIRENTHIGNRVAIGTGTIIEGHVVIGDDVSLQSMVYIPTGVIIGNRVFIGPNAVLTNDKYPPGENLQAPQISDGATIGANSTLLPGISIGRGSLIAAGSVVTKDVPDNMMAIGSPAKIENLPDEIIKRRKL